MTGAPRRLLLALVSLLMGFTPAAADEPADLVLHGGKIVTVDAEFSIRQAIALRGERILAVGDDAEILPLAGDATKIVDLKGKMVLPGLIDSHVHAAQASMIEFDHAVPDMESIADVLDYVRSRAEALGPREWIIVRQVFITRLKEQRYPTKAELDDAAPNNPVVFSTGPDASVNSLALAESGIDRDFVPAGAGKIEKDAVTGEPTGILRSASRYLKKSSGDDRATAGQRDERLEALLRDYASVGITGVIDRNASAQIIAQYARLYAGGRLPIRVRLSHAVDATQSAPAIREAIAEVARHRLTRGDERLKIIGVKTFLDGGMLTGSAYMRQPWGTSRIYSIDDPMYRGLLYIPHETLVAAVRAAVENGLQFTAHSVGDGAVDALLAAYAEVDRDTPIAGTRPCLTHSNFMSREAVDTAARLGVIVDMQPAWLYLDAHTLAAQFGHERLRWFQPLASLFEAGVIVSGGSDHMQKIGSFRSINPYNPFLAMQVAVSRKAKHYDRELHPEEALSREQAIRFYTLNGAHHLFLEDQIGSLVPGKRGDLIVLDRDLLTCPTEDISTTRVLATYVDGELVYGAAP